MIPAKADVEAQDKFLKNELEPRITEAQAGERNLFYFDNFNTSLLMPRILRQAQHKFRN